MSDVRGPTSDFERSAVPANAIELRVADPSSRRYM